MASTAKSPRKGRSSLSETNLNQYDNLNHTLPLTRVEKETVKIVAKRTMFREDSSETVELTPNKARRRSMQPRKSILKPMDFANIRESQTINFGSIQDRRVSFAANAHVRMFEDRKGDQAKRRHSTSKSTLRSSVSVPALKGPRSSLSQIQRRTSTQGISSAPVTESRFISEGEGEGEASMEMSDEEDLDESQDMSMVSTYDRRDSVASAASVDEEDDEVDMDETGVYGAGIIRRASMASTEADVSDMSIMSVTSTGTDEEKTMDFTVALGGALPPNAPAHAAKNRPSVGYKNDESPEAAARRLRPGQSVAGDSDASMDMEETGVFGGPLGADDTMSTLSDQASVEGRDRTETFSFGDLSTRANGQQQEQDDEVDDEDQDDDEDGMEMTVAMGGILSKAPVSPPTLSASTTSITRPSPGPGSYARPTLSSSQRSREPTPKAKRNIFGPSPGSAHAPKTPRDGMATASGVAKRLSFGSATSSIGKRRAIDDDEESQSGSVKKARPTIAENIFAPKSAASSPASSAFVYKSPGGNPFAHSSLIQNTPTKPVAPIQSTSPVERPANQMNRPRDSMPRNLLPPKSPRRSMGTPLRLVAVENNTGDVNVTPGKMGKPVRMSVTPQSARKLLMRSPGKSPALRRMLGEQILEEELDEAEDILDSLDLQHINLSDFMRMAKVEFMEDLPKVKRKSTVAQGLLGQRYNGADREFGLHEYAEAECHNAFLALYRWASDVIADDIQKNLAEIKKQEIECQTEMPMVMREYLAAEEEDRAMFEQTFQTYKAYTLLQAREKWYDWKMAILNGTTRPEIEDLLAGMQEDEERLNEMERQCDGVVPQLEARLLALQEELEGERAVVAEIAECDQDELAGLREAIQEQSTVIDGQTSDLEDANAKLKTLQEKLDELEKTKNVCETRISVAKSKCDQYTRSDILRFKEEYESLQGLHLWHIGKMGSDVIEMSYDHQLDLIIPCKDHIPDLNNASVSWNKANVPCKSKLRYSEESSRGIFAILEDEFKNLKRKSLKDLVRQTGSLVLSAQKLRAEFGILNTRLPTSYRIVETNSRGKGLIVTSRLMLKSVKSRVEISFLFFGEVLSLWPGGLESVEVEARTIYGSADPEIMKRAARETMMEIRDDAYVGALTQACFDAKGQYEG